MSIAMFGGFAKGPTSPVPATGHVVPVRDHGCVFYVTWRQFDFVNWLRDGGVLCLAISVAGMGLASRLSKGQPD